MEPEGSQRSGPDEMTPFNAADEYGRIREPSSPGIGGEEASSIQLVDHIYATLRTAIMSGQLEPGRRLREVPLAKEFGASTTPVREALRRLGFDGLVTIEARRGAFVTDQDPVRVRELYELREVLESKAVALATQGVIEGAGLDAVRAVAARMEEAVGNVDQVAFNLLDITFHRTLNDLGNNHLIAVESERVHRQIQTVRLRCAVHLPHQPLASHREHLAIVSAVAGHDPALASALVRAHVRSVRNAVLEVLSATRAGK